MKNKKQNTEVVKAYYSELAEMYDEATSRSTTQWKAPEKSNEFILPYVQSGDKVLDIGVGTGQSARALHEKGCEVTGIDNNGNLPSALNGDPDTAQMIGTATSDCDLCTALETDSECADIAADLVPTYVADIPVDPQVGSESNTGYYINETDAGRLVVGACEAEQDATIEVTR